MKKIGAFIDARDVNAFYEHTSRTLTLKDTPYFADINAGFRRAREAHPELYNEGWHLHMRTVQPVRDIRRIKRMCLKRTRFNR